MTGAWSLRHPQDREILRLAVPALGALVAEPLFLLADAAIVGRLGTPQLAGVGVAGAILATVVSLCVFLAYGTTAAVARRLGAGELRAAVAQGVDGIWLAAGLGLLLAGGLASQVGRVVGALGASATAAPYARTYLLVSLPGIPAMLVVLAATGLLRGLQDTRTPLFVSVVGAGANVALNVSLVYGLRLGVAGSAAGTVVVQVASAAAYAVIVRRAARSASAALRPRLAGIRTAAAAGAALVVRTLSLRAALLAATFVAARQGDVALAAHQVAFAVWNLLALVLDSLAIAGQALVGRALGAADVTLARGMTRRMLTWGVVAGVVLAVVVVALRPAYVPLFSTDPGVRRLLASVLVVTALVQPVGGAVFVLDGVLIGAGDAAYLARAGVVSLLVFLPLAGLVLVTHAGLVALWAAIGAFLLARLGTLVRRERTDAWLVTGGAR